MSSVTEQKVLWVKHHTDFLFSFATTRPPSLRFRSGEFVMIGLPQEEGRPIQRAYSMASPHYADELEFLSIKVPDGPLTSKLQKIQKGDPILIGTKPTGTLILDALKPGKRLHLIGTGTGLAPWISIVQDPETYERHERVFVDHTVRKVEDLAYRHFLEVGVTQHPLVGAEALCKLFYTPAVTQDHPPIGTVRGRVTDRLRAGYYQKWLNIPHLDPTEDRFMLCGSMAMIKETAAILEELGFQEGSVHVPGDFVIERAFVG